MSMKKKQLQKRLNFEKDIHVIPNDDWIVHDRDVNCECSPKIDEKNRQDIMRGLADKYVFVHNQIKYNKQEMN